ncbi:N-acyl homoserine lactonase family protein [Pseudonocardia xishanensis]|uniref:N-acyl homoserine lactonase family protein n=1 Tax=Pseudonocardia xishanensis TaxID=630995 RepID=UPI0031E95D3F
MSAPVEVLAVRYGRRATTRSEVFLNHHYYGEPDGPMEMDYYFWVVRRAGRTVVVDTGFNGESGGRRDRATTCAPGEALARLGIDPADVDQVFVTHAHYDHVGNLGLFPAAEVVITRRELEFWTSPLAHRHLFAVLAEERDVADLDALRRAGRLTVVDGSHTTGGLEFVEVGGHTPGQAVVRVPTPAGPVVLASDAVHYYEELERDRPFVAVADLAQAYRAFDRVREMLQDPGAVLVAGHDPLVRHRFTPHDPADPALAVRIR